MAGSAQGTWELRLQEKEKPPVVVERRRSADTPTQAAISASSALDRNSGSTRLVAPAPDPDDQGDSSPVTHRDVCTTMAPHQHAAARGAACPRGFHRGSKPATLRLLPPCLLHHASVRRITLSAIISIRSAIISTLSAIISADSAIISMGQPGSRCTDESRRKSWPAAAATFDDEDSEGSPSGRHYCRARL